MKLPALFLIFIVSTPTWALDFSGVYQCNEAYDSQDGAYVATITLTRNKAYSARDDAYATYDFSMTAKGYPYTWGGIVAANGSNLAVYFESKGPHRNPSDRGVGIATVVIDMDKSGKKRVSLHKFYYESAYKGKADYGFENCKLSK